MITTVGNLKAIGAFEVVFAILGTLFNLLSIIVIVSSANLKRRGMYITIAMISFVGILDSLFENSVQARMNLDTTNPITCQLYVANVIIVYIVIAVTMYCLLLLFVNHLIHRQQNNDSRERLVGVVGTVVIGVVCVIVYSSVIGSESLSGASCRLFTDYSVTLGIAVSAFFAPAFFLCVAGIILVISHATNRQPSFMQQNGFASDRRVAFPAHIVIAAFLAVVTQGPLFLLSVIRFTCNGTDCTWYLWLVLIFGAVARGCFVVIPLSWLTDDEFRTSSKRLFCRQDKKVATQSVNTYAYYNNQSVHPQAEPLPAYAEPYHTSISSSKPISS